MMLIIDGSRGEGGGQILRTALAASILTSTPVCIEHIRARRRNPGLAAQHLTAVRAAAAVGSAEVSGDDAGSERVEFHPGPVRTGSHHFDVGTAGSTTLVVQTVLPALVTAAADTRLTVTGGTHNEHAPPFEFFQRVFLSVVSRMGPLVTTVLERHGFYPVGGGRLVVSVRPVSRLGPVEITERGEVIRCSATAVVSRLHPNIALRELAVVKAELGWEDCAAVEVEADGPGNVLLLAIETEHATEVVSSVGRRGLPAEEVARRAVEEARLFLGAGVPVGPHLADQLLLPMAAAGEGLFRTVTPTAHFRTNVEVVQRFLPVRITTSQTDDAVLVRIDQV